MAECLQWVRILEHFVCNSNTDIKTICFHFSCLFSYCILLFTFVYLQPIPTYLPPLSAFSRMLSLIPPLLPYSIPPPPRSLSSPSFNPSIPSLSLNSFHFHSPTHPSTLPLLSLLLPLEHARTERGGGRERARARERDSLVGRKRGVPCTP